MCRNGNWNRPVSWQWSFTQIKWYAVRPTWFHPNDSKYCYKPQAWAHNDQNKPSFAWTSSNKRSSDRRTVPIQNCVMILPSNMVNMCPYCLRKFCEVIKKLTPPWSPWPSPELQLHLMAEAQEVEVEPHYFSRHLFKRTKISASKFIFSVSSKVVCLPSLLYQKNRSSFCKVIYPGKKKCKITWILCDYAVFLCLRNWAPAPIQPCLPPALLPS